MNNEMIREVVVVEGVHDRQRLESIYPGIDCIVTGGSEISDTTLRLIERANESRGVILFLDPDFPGRKITNTIMEHIPGCKIAFLSAAEAKSRNQRKIGIEHASTKAISAALGRVFTLDKKQRTGITLNDLRERNLVGNPFAFVRRQRVMEKLGLPPTNAKTFLKLANLLGLDIKTIDEVLNENNPDT